jgi:hypothetical protein
MAISNTTDRFNGVVASLAIKVRCVVGVEVNVASLSGISNPYSGVNIVDLDRVLLTAQTDAIENGVWDAKADGVWTRAFDWDGNRDVEKGSTVWAGQEIGEDKLWQVQTEGTILPGSTAVSITELLDPEIPTQNNPIVLAELVNPGADADGFGQIWVREDTPNVLVFRDDTGIDTVLGAAGGGGGVTVQDEGTPLATIADTLNFVGAGVDATGGGSTKTITIPGGGGGAVEQLVDPSANVAVIALGGGTIGIRSTGNTDAENRDLEWQHQDGTTRFSIGQEFSTAIIVRNHITGADIIFRVGTGGGNRTRLQLQGDQSTGGIIMSAGTNPSGGHLQVLPEGIKVQNTTLFIREQAAEANITQFGQLWVNAADDSLNYRTEAGVDFDLTAGGGGVTVEDEGVPLATTADTLDFVGAGVTASGAGTTKTITIPGGGGGGLQGFGTWRHRTETATPPASGQIRFNNADPTLATSMFVHETNASGPTDMAAFLALLQDGALLYLQDKSNSDNFFVIEISSNTDSGTYRTFGIQNIELEGVEPSQNQEMILVGVEAGGGGAEINDLSAVVTWANVPDANITVGSVTQHVASIDHDGLLNFVADEHIDWSVTGAEDVHTDRIPAATESAVGGAEIATQTEVNTGTDDARIVTALKAPRTFMFDPAVVISFSGDGVWGTISNTALATAGARWALLRVFCSIAPTASSFGANDISVRETGSGLAAGAAQPTNCCRVVADADASGNGQNWAVNDCWVKLDSSFDFDIMRDQTGTGTENHGGWILGYAT